jgi:hypothetical protein
VLGDPAGGPDQSGVVADPGGHKGDGQVVLGVCETVAATSTSPGW